MVLGQKCGGQTPPNSFSRKSIEEKLEAKLCRILSRKSMEDVIELLLYTLRFSLRSFPLLASFLSVLFITNVWILALLGLTRPLLSVFFITNVWVRSLLGPTRPVPQSFPILLLRWREFGLRRFLPRHGFLMFCFYGFPVLPPLASTEIGEAVVEWSRSGATQVQKMRRTSPESCPFILLDVRRGNRAANCLRARRVARC